MVQFASRLALGLMLIALLALSGCDSGGPPAEPASAEAPRYDHYGDPTPRNSGSERQPGDSTSPHDNAGQPPAGSPDGDPSGGGTNTPPPSDNGGNDPFGGDGETGLNCSALYDAVSACYSTYSQCAGACQDDACVKQCETTFGACYDAKVAAGSPTGQQEFNALRACE